MGTDATIFLVVLIVWIFTLCLHEFSHAAVAYLGGDHTVKEKGYLSFNPLAYANPMLSIVLPVVFLIMGGLALPGGCVYIDRSLLRSKWWDSLVSAAGPASNFVFAVLLSLPFTLGLVDPDPTVPLWNAYAVIIFIELIAVFFNLLPIPPLDGFGIIAPFLPEPLRDRLYSFGNIMFFLFLIAWISVPGLSAVVLIPVLIFLAIFRVPLDLVEQGYAALRIFQPN
ncbi:MAG: hypothetical protein AMXMBFR84_20150 [Candidatus Hydrogenedentota bacterium]